MMINIPTLNSVIEDSKTIYIVQLLTIVASDGAKSYLIYIQDMLTLQIVYHRKFKYSVKSRDAALIIYDFLKYQVDINPSDILFTILKLSPFANQLFIRIMVNGLNIKISFFSRKDNLGAYQTHKIIIKTLICKNPNNIEEIIKSWNKIPKNTLSDLEWTAKTL